jgi:NAD+ synthase (glutamine-hydrolysing)
LKISLAQINPTVGDFSYNIGLIVKYYDKAIADGADLVVFPELCLCGYPPEDLLLKKHFLDHNTMGLEAIAQRCSQKTLVVGFAQPCGDGCYNAAAVIKDGKIVDVYHKRLLPNYGVFDERRYFLQGEKAVCFEVEGIRIALSICEDIWQSDEIAPLLDKIDNKHLLLNISASPFHKGKIEQRKHIISRAAGHFDTAVAYCNMVGGQDELVFDGRSLFMNIAGMVLSKAAVFAEDMISAKVTLDEKGRAIIEPLSGHAAQPADSVEEIYGALVLGTRDYVRKNGFKKVIMGLSGGIDSALVAAIAVEALGKENLIGVTMPSKFNSAETISDAGILAQNLGIEFHTIAIGDTLSSFHQALSLVEGWDDTGTAYENLQARIRGTILMSLSNQNGYMVLTTGNKSETAVGYSTLYGDTAGGFAMIKDVPKTLVFRLSEYVNIRAGRELIPQTTISRPPSAELRDQQKDSDSLPDYDMLDDIVTHYVELDKSAAEIVSELPFAAADVNRVIKLIDSNEYKRRQSPPGIKITPKAFGRDRRLPITNRYRTAIPRVEF